MRSYTSLYEITAGTDDDNPPSHQNRVPRGSRVAGIARSAVGSISHTRMHTDMEAQIHHLEQEAYCAVLRAFQAQSDAISWVFSFSLFPSCCMFFMLISRHYLPIRLNVDYMSIHSGERKFVNRTSE